MDTQRLAAATRFHRLAVTLTFDPSADASERWLACIGFDCYGAGPTADEALDAAMNREALGPDPLPMPDEDAGDWFDDPRALGEMQVLAGRR